MFYQILVYVIVKLNVQPLLKYNHQIVYVKLLFYHMIIFTVTSKLENYLIKFSIKFCSIRHIVDLDLASQAGW